MKLTLKKVFLLSSAIIMLATSRSFADMNVSRVYGSDRYETSLSISNKFEKSNYIFIASGEKYPDANMGGSLVTQTTSPILLVNKNRISNKTLSEISRLSPSKIFILGGEDSISKKVTDSIKNYTSIPFERISGKDRYETANEISYLRSRLSGSNQDFQNYTRAYSVGVSSSNFYDALYVAPYIGLHKFDNNRIISLSFCKSTLDFSEYSIDLDLGTIIGDVKEKNRNKDLFYPVLIKGVNRYETSTMIADDYNANGVLNINYDTIVITSGENYPDGLSSSGLTALNKTPIILTPKDKLDKSVVKFIKSKNNIKRIIIVGGEDSVSKNIENELIHLK